MLSGPLGMTKPMPFLAFNSPQECEAAMTLLPKDSKSDCVAFAADISDGKAL